MLTGVPDENPLQSLEVPRCAGMSHSKLFLTFKHSHGTLTTCHQSFVWSLVEDGRLFQPIAFWTLGVIVPIWPVTCYNPWTLLASIVSLSCLLFLESVTGDLGGGFGGWFEVWPCISLCLDLSIYLTNFNFTVGHFQGCWLFPCRAVQLLFRLCISEWNYQTGSHSHVCRAEPFLLGLNLSHIARWTHFFPTDWFPLYEVSHLSLNMVLDQIPQVNSSCAYFVLDYEPTYVDP